MDFVGLDVHLYTSTLHVPDVDIRSWRELIEFRRKEVAKRTRVKNGIRGLLRVQGVMVPTPVRDLWTQEGRRWLHTFGFDDAHAQFQLQILLTQLEQTDRVVAAITERLDALAEQRPHRQLLCVTGELPAGGACRGGVAVMVLH